MKANRGVSLTVGDSYSRMFDPPNDDEPNPVWELRSQVLQAGAAPYLHQAREYAELFGLNLDDPDVEAAALRAALVMGRRRNEQRREFNEHLESNRHEPVVYLMRQGNMVKIGTSRSITGRMAAIRAQEVLSLEFGGYDREKELHRAFAMDRSHGEWFNLNEAITLYAVHARQQFEAQVGTTVENWIAARRLHDTAAQLEP